MKKKVAFLLICCFLLWNNQITKANSADARSVAGLPAPCNLPAPANLQYTQPTSYSVQFTWDPVPGAVAYRSTLMNLSNGSQSISIGAPNNSNFAVIPGDDYLFVVAAMCSVTPPETSMDTSQLSFRADYIVIDLVVDMPGCDVDDPVYDSIPGNGTGTFDHDWTNPAAQYFIELTRFNKPPAQPDKVRLAFRYIPASTGVNHSFELRGFDDNPAGWNLCGQSATGNCQSAPADPFSVVHASNAKVTFGGRTCRISFPVTTQLYHYVLTNQNPIEVPFDEFRIYGNCRGGGFGRGGSAHRSDRKESDPAAPEKSGIQILTVNPFSTHLTLNFSAIPRGIVKTRLFDLQGIPKIETVIEPDQLLENRYSLQTASLPSGMYFLQIKMPSGEIITRKVLKI